MKGSVKVASSATEFSENIGKGEYKAGDVVQYTDDNGNLQIFVYTGIEGNDIVVGIN
jgi:predicted RNA-binding protein (virulence factor B family)